MNKILLIVLIFLNQCKSNLDVKDERIRELNQNNFALPTSASLGSHLKAKTENYVIEFDFKDILGENADFKIIKQQSWDLSLESLTYIAVYVPKDRQVGGIKNFVNQNGYLYIAVSKEIISFGNNALYLGRSGQSSGLMDSTQRLVMELSEEENLNVVKSFKFANGQDVLPQLAVDIDRRVLRSNADDYMYTQQLVDDFPRVGEIHVKTSPEETWVLAQIDQKSAIESLDTVNAKIYMMIPLPILESTHHTILKQRIARAMDLVTQKFDADLTKFLKSLAKDKFPTSSPLSIVAKKMQVDFRIEGDRLFVSKILIMQIKGADGLKAIQLVRRTANMDLKDGKMASQDIHLSQMMEIKGNSKFSQNSSSDLVFKDDGEVIFKLDNGQIVSVNFVKDQNLKDVEVKMLEPLSSMRLSGELQESLFYVTLSGGVGQILNGPMLLLSKSGRVLARVFNFAK